MIPKYKLGSLLAIKKKKKFIDEKKLPRLKEMKKYFSNLNILIS